MDEKFRQELYDTFSEVFETMFFTLLEPVEEIPGAETFSAEEAYIRANISYHGPESGSFSLFMPLRLSRKITMNFLGADEEDVTSEQVMDTAKETANMVVGSLLGRIDPDGKTKLHIPEANLVDDLSLRELFQHSGVILFNTDYGPFWVIIQY